MTHQALIGQDTTNPQVLRNGIDLFREGAGESGAVWRPFQIVSLLDMIEFKPLLLSIQIENLRKMESMLAEMSPQEQDVTAPTGQFLIEMVHDIEALHIETLGMRDEIGRCTSGLLSRLAGGLETIEKGSRSVATIKNELRFLRQEIEHALKQRLFLCMPSDEAAFYEQPALFGENFGERFPEANKEITVAGNCYAIHSYTACVFHLTRAVEIAARVMVSALNVQGELKNQQSGKIVPVKLCTWETLLTGLEKGVKAKEANISTSPVKRETYEFYSHAVSQFRSFKDAWRNKVSHKRKTYQAGEAKDIMETVKLFMLHVCKRLKEPKDSTFD